MAITTTYLGAKTALIRLGELDWDKVKEVLDRGASMGLEIPMTAWKGNLRKYFQDEISREFKEAAVEALAGAVESGLKNSMLTPVIASIPVNPVNILNLAEQAEVLADGASALRDLNNIVSKVNTILQ